MGPMIEVDDVVVDYQSKASSRRALDHVSLSVAPGEALGLLGPNGAGKTTLTKVLSTLLTPTSGSARIGGLDVVAQRRQVQRAIGVAFGGDLGLYSRLSGEHNLRFFGAMYGLGGADLRRRIGAVLDMVSLADRGKDRVETYSRGMRERLHIARAILHDPPVLLLDEPTSGLDPLAAAQMRDLVQELKGAGRSLLLTTHNLTEAEAVCDGVVLLHQGTVVRSGSPRELRAAAASRSGTIIEVGVDLRPLSDALVAAGLAAQVTRTEGRSRFQAQDVAAAVEVITAGFPEALPSLRLSEPSLQDVFIDEMTAR